MDKIPISDELIRSLNMQLCDAIIFETAYNDDLNYKHDSVETVYHYTDLNALISIIEKQTLWATNLYFLNDRNEFKHGISLIFEILEQVNNKNLEAYIREIQNEIDFIKRSDRYITCFSKNGDLLSQWRAYASDGKGVSIGFNGRNLASALNGHVSTKYILYDREKQRKAVSRIISRGIDFFAERKPHIDYSGYDYEKTVAKSLLSFLESIIADYKDEGFAEEREYRLEYWVPDFQKEKFRQKAKYRTNGKFIIPYIELETQYQYYLRCSQSEDFEMPTLTQTRLPIEEIIVGPALNFDDVKPGIEYLLAKNGYSDVLVKHSCIPYRA